MESKVVVANHKMNLTAPEVSKYLKKISKINNQNVIICPTSIYVPYFLKQGYSVGLQNISYNEKGAYTGEISPMQASSMGIKYAIVGHSERRELFAEKDYEVHAKVVNALNNNMGVIICVGETDEERDMLRTEYILKREIRYALKDVSVEEEAKIMIAYEPIWSIGTGKVPKNNEIKEIVEYIKQVFKRLGFENVKILYGGSVNEKNIKELKKVKEIDGFLVGGASLNPDKFLKIVEVAVK